MGNRGEDRYEALQAERVKIAEFRGGEAMVEGHDEIQRSIDCQRQAD